MLWRRQDGTNRRHVKGMESPKAVGPWRWQGRELEDRMKSEDGWLVNGWLVNGGFGKAIWMARGLTGGGWSEENLARELKALRQSGVNS
jgi:hypothetical protein